jgi:Tol biopolymer transport system component
MAPEQLEGRNVDSRADIFALGAVIYEMTTGRKAFEGGPQASLIAKILTATPTSIATLQPLAPASLNHVLLRCLEKDPDERWQTAQDLRKELEWISSSSGAASVERTTPEVKGLDRWRRRLLITTAVVLAGIAGGVISRRSTPPKPTADLVQYEIQAPWGTTLTLTPRYGSPVISPDGSKVAFIASRDGKQQLYVRTLNSLDLQALSGTEGAHYPFWSPDSLSIGFFALGKLNAVGIPGGTPRVICNVGDPGDNQGKGGTWNRAGDIIFATTRGQPLFRVSSLGGIPEQITELDASRNEESHRWPVFLPDGRHFLYLVRGKTGALYAGSLDSRERTLLLDNHDSNVIFAQPGFLLFIQGKYLVASPFDPAKLKVTGPPVQIAGPVAVSTPVNLALMSVSANGRLAFFNGVDTDIGRVIRLDRNGKLPEEIGPDTHYRSLSLSPDGQKVAYSRRPLSPSAAAKIWILDIMSGSQSSITADMSIPSSSNPVWAGDNKQLFFSGRSSETEPEKVFQTSLYDVEKPRIVVQSNSIRFFPTDISRDGRFLLLESSQDNLDRGIWYVSLAKREEPREFLDTSFQEFEARFSPDGRWVVYLSLESGRSQVYIREFPSGANKRVISAERGMAPRWSPDGKEVLYLSYETLMAAPLDPMMKPGVSKPLFKMPGVSNINRDSRWWDMSRDGQYFYTIIEPDADRPPAINIVLNWMERLKP